MHTLPPQPDLDIPALEQMLELKNLTNSYKLYWFAALVDEISRLRHQVTFRRMVILMVTGCWYSVLAFRLNFGAQDRLHELVNYIHETYGLAGDIPEQELADFLENLYDPEWEKLLEEFYKYVPFRLLTPFYPELSMEKKDHARNKMIESLSRTGNRGIYRIFSDEQRIEVHPDWFEYIYCNMPVIQGWLSYRLIYFLQSRNPNVPAIPFKLSAPRERDLVPASRFWKRVIALGGINDIYSGELLGQGGISIDHFIPWSFVLHDRLWNLVPTTRGTNSSKGDRLPPVDPFLDRFCDIQYRAFKTALAHGFPKKSLEDYLDIPGITLSTDIPAGEFSDRIRDTIMPLYQIARNQGFGIWGV